MKEHRPEAPAREAECNALLWLVPVRVTRDPSYRLRTGERCPDALVHSAIAADVASGFQGRRLAGLTHDGAPGGAHTAHDERGDHEEGRGHHHERPDILSRRLQRHV